MCNQTVSLVAAELERQGITTVAIQLLREVAERVGPPRALLVPFRHGYPLGRPNDPLGQSDVIEAAFAMLDAVSPSGPLLKDYVPPASD
ncbi:MAG: hypothetical protein SGJ01_08775 [Gemmatimonadota bacterium]|nr:hypothetical protein [Gemmatimonadota bacterium]